MKKALLLSVLLLWVGAALRAAPANATFTSEWGVPFQLIFDGQPQSRLGTQVVHIDRLTPGFHWAEFLIPNGNGRVTTLRARVVLDGGLESSYVLLARPGYGVQLRKVGQVPIRRGYSIFDAQPSGPVSPTPTRNYSNGPAPYATDSVAPAAPVDTYSDTAGLDSAWEPLTKNQLNELVSWMRSAISDDARLEAAQQLLAPRTIRTDDLARLLAGLATDEARLALVDYTCFSEDGPCCVLAARRGG